MNWETFKQLTKEEREEYQYKFGEEPDTGMNYIYTTLVGVGLVFFHILLFYAITISTNETLLQYRNAIGLLMNQDLKVLMVFILLMCIRMFYAGVMSIIFSTRRNRWLKKHNIKTHWWKDAWK